MELIKLDDSGNAAAGEMLTKHAGSEADNDVRYQIQGHFARKLLAAAKGNKMGVLKKLIADSQPGFRIVAVEELAKLGTPEAKALISGLANDGDDDVQMAVEEALGGDDDE